jgi:alpha-tubulin suppressor-like RCC1 family protein
MENLQVVIDAIQSTTPVGADQTPFFGNFYSAQWGISWPPLPSNPLNLPCWRIDDSHFVMDDRNVDYAALEAEAEAAALLSAPLATPLSMVASSLLNTAIAYGNPAYFTNMAAAYDGSAVAAGFGIAGGTNNIPYDILMTTNVTDAVSQWTWLGIGYTANSYTFSNQPLDQAFYILAKPQKTMTVGWGDDSVGQCSVPTGITNALMVAGGGGQSLALLSDGTVVAWGQNYYGQATVPTNLAGVAMIAAGWYHSVALLTNGTVTAWGLDAGNIGWHLTDVPSDVTNATVISAQALHTLALRSNGTVVAWGYNAWGETNVPPGLSNVVAIAAGYQFSLAVKADGTVAAWGRNSLGQTTMPAGLSNVVDVAAGPYHSLALLNDGTVIAWGDGSDGETNIPPGLTNVVAIAAGGDPYSDTAYSLALKSDGTVVAWGEGEPLWPVGGLNNVIAVAAGADHALAIRTGPPTPVITLEPTDQYQLAGGNVTFTARGAGIYGVTYQWQTNGVDIAGATTNTLTVSNVQSAQAGTYDVVVTDNGGMGSIVSPNANLYLVTPPGAISQTPSNGQILICVGNTVALSVAATAPGEDDGFPLSYQWQLNGTNILGKTGSNYTFSAASSGTYSVIVSNAAGSTNVSWQVYVLYPGSVGAWGENEYGESTPQVAITNISAIAAGEYHSVAVEDNGTVIQWGYNWGDVPADLTNAVAVAAGFEHSIALRSDGTVETWGATNADANYVPTGLSRVTAVAAGWIHNVALLTNGTVTAWGDGLYGVTNVPPGLTNATAISAQAHNSLALKSDGTVVAWGNNSAGQTNVPAGLSNVVAVAAGGQHSLALKAGGTVVAWGYNGSGQTNVPLGLSNVMAIAAGAAHSVALKNDGTLVVWGDGSDGQTNPPAIDQVKLIAAGGGHTLAAISSRLVQYPLDVTKDLLLIYNTNSVDSAFVKDYYLGHRPMVTGANVLGIGCSDRPSFFPDEYTNVFAAQVQSWLASNPTKRPQYVVLFMGIPWRVNTEALIQYDEYPDTVNESVQYQLNAWCAAGWHPFVAAINMRDNDPNQPATNACVAYINKLA